MKILKLAVLATTLSLGLGACSSSKKISANSEPYRTLKHDLELAEVTRMRDTIRIVYPELAMFDFGKDEIKPEARKSIIRFGNIMKDYNEISIKINGHTDNVGTDEVNRDLSLRRANNSRDLLQANGIAGSRMTTAGMGAEDPIESNKSEEGRQANRRVEFLLYRTGGAW